MPEKKTSFEQAVKEMEKIIARLESEDVSLTEALKSFEQGVKLMRICDSHLKNAEGALKELYKGENGEFIEKILGAPFNPSSEGRTSDD